MDETFETTLDDEFDPEPWPCGLCGYVSHGETTQADMAHDDLCCGMTNGTCGYYAQDGMLCATHAYGVRQVL